MSLRLTCWQGGGMKGLKMGIVGHGAHMEVVIYYMQISPNQCHDIRSSDQKAKYSPQSSYPVSH